MLRKQHSVLSMSMMPGVQGVNYDELSDLDPGPVALSKIADCMKELGESMMKNIMKREIVYDKKEESSEEDFNALFALIAGGTQSLGSPARTRHRSQLMSVRNQSVRRMTLCANGAQPKGSPEDRKSTIMLDLIGRMSDDEDSSGRYRLVFRLINECDGPKTEQRYISSSKVLFRLDAHLFDKQQMKNVDTLRNRLLHLTGSNEIYINDPVSRANLFKQLEEDRLNTINEKKDFLRLNEAKRMKSMITDGLISKKVAESEIKRLHRHKMKPYIIILEDHLSFCANPMAFTYKTLENSKMFDLTTVYRESVTGGKFKYDSVTVDDGDLQSKKETSVVETLVERESKQALNRVISKVKSKQKHLHKKITHEKSSFILKKKKSNRSLNRKGCVPRSNSSSDNANSDSTEYDVPDISIEEDHPLVLGLVSIPNSPITSPQTFDIVTKLRFLKDDAILLSKLILEKDVQVIFSLGSGLMNKRLGLPNKT